MELEDILKKYISASNDPDNAGYSPLQCAIYDGVIEHVKLLLENYRDKGTLSQELAFISPATQTKENILQIAMKHSAILELCCQTIEDLSPQLFVNLIQHRDADEDTIYHQSVEFGRDKSLDILNRYLVRHVDLSIIGEVFLQENKHQETALYIAENYEQSAAVSEMRAAKILPLNKDIKIALSEILELFENYDLSKLANGMRA